MASSGQPFAQAGSPPPLTCAVLCCVVPSIEACGVTLIVNVAVLFGATLDRPDATLHVTVWLLTVQVGLPGVVELMVKPVGTVSFAWSNRLHTDVETLVFKGDREQIRTQAAAHALRGLLKLLDEREG